MSRAARTATAAALLTLLGVLPSCASASGTASRSALGQEAYVATGASGSDPGTNLVAVDLPDRTVGRPVAVDTPSVLTGQAATEPAGLASTPDGRTMVVTARAADQVLTVDTTTGRTVGRTTSRGVEPDAVAVTPDGTTALVANFGSGTVTPLTLTGAIPHAGTPIPVGSEPDAVAVTPDGTTALVANFGSDTVTPLTLTGAIPHAGTPIPVGTPPPAIAVTPDGTTAWIAGGIGLVPVAVSTAQVGAAIGTASPAEAVALAPGPTGGTPATAWVATQNGKLVPVDLATKVVGSPIAIGGRPSALLIPPPRR